MKKISFTIIFIVIIFSLGACTQVEQEQENLDEYLYDSPYTKEYDFNVEIINEVYFDYHDVFAGVYLVDGGYNLNVT